MYIYRERERERERERDEKREKKIDYFCTILHVVEHSSQ